MLGDLLTCAVHRCPLIAVGADYVCLFEYLDAHIGGMEIADVLRERGGIGASPLKLVFADGHVLPLLCPCCGGPLTPAVSVRAVLDRTRGKALVALDYTPARAGDPEYVDLIVSRGPARRGPGRPGRRRTPVGIPEHLQLHLDAARQLVCPNDPPCHLRAL